MKKSAAILLSGLLLASTLTPTMGHAASKVTKKLDATYNNIKIMYNQQQVQSDIEPFIVNGTTYIPLRMMGNLFKKSIEWDGTNYTINVTEAPDSMVNILQLQLSEKNNQLLEKEKELNARSEQIKELERKIRDLEEESKPDLDDLEDELNDDFSDYEDIEFDISLDGDEEDLELDIDVDLDEYQDEWDDLSSDDVEELIEDIVEYIRDEYEDVSIEGQIKDGSKKLVTFEVNRSGRLEMDNDTKSISDVVDLVKSRYTNSWSGMTFDLEDELDDDNITFTLQLDYDQYQDNWDDLSDNQIERLLENIYEEIEDEFPAEDYDIDVIIVDSNNNNTMATYTQDSDGDSDFRRKSGY